MGVRGLGGGWATTVRGWMTTDGGGWVTTVEDGRAWVEPCML